MTTFLKFPAEDRARQALAPWMIDTEDAWPVYIDQAAVDVVGIINVPTGETALDENGDPYPLYTPVLGYHINLSSPVPELAAWEVPAPATPTRVFATAEPEPVRVPTEVARWQAKTVLMQTGLWDGLLALRAGIPEGESATLLDAAMFEVLNWRRASPTVVWAAQSLGLTEQQVDSMFIQAAALDL